jgi:hypothetical protein
LSHLTKRHFRFLMAALVVVILRTATVNAAVIVNDTWRDGTDDDPIAPVYSEVGADTDLDGDIESAWYQGGVGSLQPVGANGPLRGDMTVGGTSSASWTTYFTQEASPVTLANTGDFLRVTWTFTPSTVNAANTSQNFRFALVDSPSAQRLAANGAPASGAYTGYAMFGNMAQTLGNANPFRLMRRNVASDALLSASGAWTGIGTTGATSGNAGYASGTSYTMNWLITRNSLGELDHDLSMTGGTLDGDGTAQVLFTDTTPGALGGYTFDTFAIRPSGATTTAELFDTSRFQVETNVAVVPEPTSLVLLSLGSLAVALSAGRRSRS